MGGGESKIEEPRVVGYEEKREYDAIASEAERLKLGVCPECWRSFDREKTAVSLGHADCLQALVAKSPVLQVLPGPLMAFAIERGQMECLYVLASTTRAEDAHIYGAGTPLHCAARMGNAEAAEALLGAHHLVDARDQQGATPLHVAAATGFHKVCDLLVNNGANTNATDNSGQTPLIVAIEQLADPVEIGSLLISAGAKLDLLRRDGATPLHIAAEAHCLPLVKLMLDKGAAIDAKTWGGETPLAFCLRQPGGEETARLLLARGADPFLVPDGAHPLTSAIQYSKRMEVLLSAHRRGKFPAEPTDRAPLLMDRNVFRVVADHLRPPRAARAALAPPTQQ